MKPNSEVQISNGGTSMLPTTHLRVVKLAGVVEVLQQLWADDNNQKYEWRDVPIVPEDVADRTKYEP